MQTLLLFYIEGATFIGISYWIQINNQDDTDDKWEIISLFEKLSDGQYHFAGFVTYYNYYYYPDKSRMKISQFMILPPFQRQGHGSYIYTYLVNQFLSRKEVADFGGILICS